MTSADGASQTLPILRPDRGCAGEGNAYFNGGTDFGAGLADLGTLPYAYSVRLVMDGTTYTGTATYPPSGDIGEAELEEQLESLAEGSGRADLTFDPPLPAYTG